MKAASFWKAVTIDEADLLNRLLADFAREGIRYCVIGGQAVNACTEPVVSLDLDVVVALDQIADLETALAGYRLRRFEHSLEISVAHSDLRVQIRTDPRYASFLDAATERDVLGVRLPVAAVEDVLEGKVWAALDPSRRASKRQKDLADISRLLEARPDLRSRVPQTLLDRLL